MADAQARIIRSLFAAEQDFLPAPYAAELKVLLEQPIGLRAYYPATEEFYEAVRSGHLETPLPMDPVEEFIHGVLEKYEPNVAGTLQGVESLTLSLISRHISPPDEEAPKSEGGRLALQSKPLEENEVFPSKREAAEVPAINESAYAPGPRAKAVLKGIEIVEQDLRSSGGSYDLEQVRELMHGQSTPLIDSRVREGSLLAVPGRPVQQRWYGGGRPEGSAGSLADKEHFYRT